jgi:hypothetical protein
MRRNRVRKEIGKKKILRIEEKSEMELYYIFIMFDTFYCFVILYKVLKMVIVINNILHKIFIIYRNIFL